MAWSTSGHGTEHMAQRAHRVWVTAHGAATPFAVARMSDVLYTPTPPLAGGAVHIYLLPRESAVLLWYI